MTAKRLFIVAGELSGDYLGAKLLSALHPLMKEQGLEVAGVGGPLMTQAGLTSLFPMEELAVMGLLEVLPRLRRLRARMAQTVQAVADFQPDLLLTIDSPGFCLRLAKRVRHSHPNLPLWHYVAPSVWAWKPQRAAKMAALYDGLLALLPFEPPYFTAEGLDCRFVGHPIVESGADRGDGQAFRARHQLASDTPLLCLLAGSRTGEVERHLPLFIAAASQLSQKIAGLTLVLIVPEHLQELVQEMLRAAPGDCPLPYHLVGATEKYDAMAASHLALAASGTVTLELALAGVPSVVAYRVNPLTYQIAKRLIRVPYASLINLLNMGFSRGFGRGFNSAGQPQEDHQHAPPVIPELIQQAATPSALADALAALWQNPMQHQAQTDAARRALQQLGYGESPSPSQQAAAVIASVLSGIEG
ncbi:MAG: lipid-A-disaccharide synthase [Alphaproteobacteria bacterium]|nr:lipid-A-disaccharide synthase [Alphaproteobacteria bacterium]